MTQTADGPKLHIPAKHTKLDASISTNAQETRPTDALDSTHDTSEFEQETLRTDHSYSVRAPSVQPYTPNSQTDHSYNAHKQTIRTRLDAPQTDHSYVRDAPQTDHSYTSDAPQTDHSYTLDAPQTDHSYVRDAPQTDHSYTSDAPQTDHSYTSGCTTNRPFVHVRMHHKQTIRTRWMHHKQTIRTCGMHHKQTIRTRWMHHKQTIRTRLDATTATVDSSPDVPSDHFEFDNYVAASEEVKSDTCHYDELRSDITQLLLSKFASVYSMNLKSEKIQVVEMYPSKDKVSVKLNVTIDQNYRARIFVHKVQLDEQHDFWIGLPKLYDCSKNIERLLSKLQLFTVCVGNCDEEYQALVPSETAILESSSGVTGYREGDMGAIKGNLEYQSTLRNTKCKLLVQGARCSQCSGLRSILRARALRLQEKEKQSRNVTQEPNFISRSYKHSQMSKNELIGKIKQQQSKITSLQQEVHQIQRRFDRELRTQGVDIDVCQSLELKDAMATCTGEMEKAFPNANSFQRLFWMQQFKSLSVKSSKGMRWHPMILRWCLYLRHKSNAAYESLRDSGFITLPSTRTLFDYSHYIQSGNGFQSEVIDVLKQEATKKGMYSEKEPWRNFVGLLFDEIKIKSDLVYDKHSGELIGYCNLDKVGNQIMDFEKFCKESTDADIAKYMLVVMVRGVTSDLKFPLAGFSTQSITADFLYPIIWKAVRILETSKAKLRVLFITCDGASANRRFFKLHGNINQFINCTPNPYAHDERNIYFISDAPHLLKTTRNCFSNSYGNKNTRKMWKSGRDISWLHIMRLFEEHCERNIYNPCPKLTNSHVHLTSFSCMKVNLAAQVLSSTVANALEMMYGDNVAETVNFIRHMDKFFDCLNVRHLYEGRNKRNENLNPYTSTDDARLKWLTDDFLGYFAEWEASVQQRPGNFNKSAKEKMRLSHQTVEGLKITVTSVVECVKFMLNEGAKFLMTHNFNQDPLEQQFGHYRHRAGDNNNPTAYDIRNAMTEMRAVGAQALDPRRSNILADRTNLFVVDNTPLPKRARHRH